MSVLREMVMRVGFFLAVLAITGSWPWIVDLWEEVARWM